METFLYLLQERIISIFFDRKFAACGFTGPYMQQQRAGYEELRKQFATIFNQDRPGRQDIDHRRHKPERHCAYQHDPATTGELTPQEKSDPGAHAGPENYGQFV